MFEFKTICYVFWVPKKVKESFFGRAGLHSGMGYVHLRALTLFANLRASPNLKDQSESRRQIVI